MLLKAVKIGNEFTVTDETANEADKQPKLLVPITEYELVIEGETTAEPDENVQLLAPIGERV